MIQIDAAQVTPETLLDEVSRLKARGWRLITLTCVDIDEAAVEILYHFDKDLAVTHLRMLHPKTDKAPSISGIYSMAFLVENEIQDLFGICFEGLVLDYERTLYLDEEVRATPFCKYTVKERVGGDESTGK
ncbi:MAG: NADH-quinone oxidoreductase subunit C [Desulfohalobiaceae bacterium]